MSEPEEYRKELDALCRRVLDALGGGGKTAWELKMELQVSHTLLHLSLGMLFERGRLRLTPDNLTLRVVPVLEGPAQPQDAGAAAGAQGG